MKWLRKKLCLWLLCDYHDELSQRIAAVEENAASSLSLNSQAANSVNAMSGWLRKDHIQTQRIEVLERWAQEICHLPAIEADAPSLEAIRAAMKNEEMENKNRKES